MKSKFGREKFSKKKYLSWRHQRARRVGRSVGGCAFHPWQRIFFSNFSFLSVWLSFFLIFLSCWSFSLSFLLVIIYCFFVCLSCLCLFMLVVFSCLRVFLFVFSSSVVCISFHFLFFCAWIFLVSVKRASVVRTKFQCAFWKNKFVLQKIKMEETWIMLG